MAAARLELLDFGAFDERPSLRFTAEDNDLAFRWIKSGRSLFYDPTLTVWHWDWRSPQQMAEVLRRYARGQGAFYAKHLWRFDRTVIRFCLGDLRSGVRLKLKRHLSRQREAIPKDYQIPWTLIGLAHGTWDVLRQAPTQLRRRTGAPSA